MNLKTILKPLAWIALTLALSAYLERHRNANADAAQEKTHKNIAVYTPPGN